MTSEDEELIKVVVPLGPPFEPKMRERMWAAPLEEPDHCEIRNTPWDAYGLNWGDRVRIEAPGDDLPEVQEVVQPSGHRTVRVIFNTDVLEPEHVKVILDDLNELDTTHEYASGRLYGLDVEPSADYDKVRAMLVEHHDAGRLIFEEAWKGSTHDAQESPPWL